MIRKFFPEHQYRDKYGFRWRGGEVSRLEGFSDAVFAFSVTLLIVSLEVPKTFAELLQTMRGFLAFAASFAIIAWIWHVHYMFFRRYGLQDAFTKTVNAILLFLVLFYVYPLKFVFTNVIRFWSGDGNATMLADGSIVPIIQENDPTTMMIVYGLGFVAVFFSYSLLYINANQKREELRLSSLETYLTRTWLSQYVICVAIGILSIAIVLVGGDEAAALSGFSYALLGPVLAFNGYFRGKKAMQLRQQMNLAHQQRQQQPHPQHPQQRQQQQSHLPPQQHRHRRRGGGGPPQ